VFWRTNLEVSPGVGVPSEAFGRFFPLLAETCRGLLGEAWTAQIEAAWRDALARVARLTPI
jgi:hypothetical protein